MMLRATLLLSFLASTAASNSRVVDTSAATREALLSQKARALKQVHRLLYDPLVDVDPTTLTQEQILSMTTEELEEEDEYMGCLCPCDLPDGEDGVLIHTTDKASDELDVEDYEAGEEFAEASHVLCVDDLLSIEFNSEGRGTCDEECFFGMDSGEEATGSEDESYEEDDFEDEADYEDESEEEYDSEEYDSEEDLEDSEDYLDEVDSEDIDGLGLEEEDSEEDGGY